MSRAKTELTPEPLQLTAKDIQAAAATMPDNRCDTTSAEGWDASSPTQYLTVTQGELEWVDDLMDDCDLDSWVHDRAREAING